MPRVAAGYALTTLAPLPVPTSITFGPGDADGDDLYATTLGGSVVRVHLVWAPAGPVFGGVSTVASGFSQPLGLAFGPDGALYVADSTGGAESGRLDGRVTRVEKDGARTVVVDGLPNGRHNTNNLRFGPDGRLYIANGNPNDNGVDGGDADVHPYSGAILSVDAAQVSASPAVFRWLDGDSARIPDAEVASHAANADFRAKVQVLGSGFRNVYDVAFGPEGAAYTATNGADVPNSQDLLYKISPGADHGFPYCFNEGPAGGVGDEISVVPSPVFGDAGRCAAVPPATALLGWHVCATGLDVAPPLSKFPRAAFVAECGPFFAHTLLPRMLAEPAAASHSTGHKVAMVELDESGEAISVVDFVSGLALPTDVLFGPDGALYVADAVAVHRIERVLPGATATGAEAPSSTPIVSGPAAQSFGYLTADAYMLGDEIEYKNYDIIRHNVVAQGVYGPDTNPWCTPFPKGKCPLFWTPLIESGVTVAVQGVDKLEYDRAYPFYCTLHPAMTGTITRVSGPV